MTIVGLKFMVFTGLTTQVLSSDWHLGRPSRGPSEVRRAFRLRGGSQDYPSGQYNDATQYMDMDNQGGPDFNYPDDVVGGGIPMHETVQERVDNWRKMQAEQASQAQISARDEQGRVKLLTSVSKGSRALIFFILMWRCTALYEIADKTRNGMARLILVVPLAFLFIGNMAGAVASLTSPSHSAKKRLKAILNLDKLVEAALIVYSFLRLTILPSVTTPREIYIASIMHSVFFILQCQAFTKLSWSEQGPTIQSYAAATTGEQDPYNDSAPPAAFTGNEWTEPTSPEQWQDERF